MKLLQIFGILMAMLFMASCNQNEDQGTGVGDVIMISKKSGANTVYGLSIIAYNNYSSFSSVRVVAAADSSKIYTLKANQGIKTNFFYETPESEFSTTQPLASVYNFTATFENGAKQTFQNTLTGDILPIPTFDKCEYNNQTHQLELEWPLLIGAGSYAINIMEGTKIVFSSLEIKNPSKAAFFVTKSGDGWAAGFTPEEGKTYTVRLFAYLFEPGGGMYNMQSISIADSHAVWGN